MRIVYNLFEDNPKKVIIWKASGRGNLKQRRVDGRGK